MSTPPNKGESNGKGALGTRSVRRHRVGRARALALVFASLLAGCGSPKMAPIPMKTMAEFTCRTSSEGLAVAVEAWTGRDRVKKHFGMDLLSRQIVPFEIAFANMGAEGGFLLQPELAALLDDSQLKEIRSAPGGTVPPPPDPTVLAITYVAISPIFAVGLVLLAEEVYFDEQAVRRHMNAVQFIDRALYRSDSNKGFLYLQFRDMADLSKMAAVTFRVKNVRTRQEKTLLVTLKGR